MSDPEDDFNPRAHTSLLNAIGSLKKTQHIRQSTRNEPRIKQDEFELAKVAPAKHVPAQTTVAVNDLVKVLHKTKKHLDAGKLLSNVHRTKKVFKKPLEKPAAERIKRQIGYDKVKANLKRWDAVVSKNRSSETQVFPLAAETVYINTSLDAKPLENTIKSDLRREMEAAEEKLRQLKRQRDGDLDDEEALQKRQKDLHKIQLTREELIARRKELAYLKMRESQQSARARLRNKIKSKKYHKLLRRQKLQEQLKEFEKLQKTDPEAALEKLNELEKSRVRERASLRHKNTGAWAKNLQVRAKYDKDVRKDLAEQLQISRELTQKKANVDDNSDEETGDGVSETLKMEDKDEICDDPSNPWITTARKKLLATKNLTQENDENWRKYWMDRNRNEKLLDAYKNDLNEATKQQGNDAVEEKPKMKEIKNAQKHVPTEKKSNPKENVAIEAEQQENNVVKVKQKLKEMEKAPKRVPTEKTSNLKENVAVEEEQKVKEIKKTQKRVPTEMKSNPKAKKPKKSPKYENGWIVEEIDPAEVAAPLPDIDDLFDEVENQIETRVQEKMNKLSAQAKQRMAKERKIAKPQRKERDELKNLKDLTFKENAQQHPTLDEELGDESEEAKNKADISAAPPNMVNQQTKVITAAADSTTSGGGGGNIDPMKFPTVTMKQPRLNALATAIEDDGLGVGDADDDVTELDGHNMTINEAFEDDDIVADFGEEKTKDSELKNTELELTMPGWGSWAGAGIDESKRRKPNKRIVLKLAAEEKRRDENKDAIYINEEATSKQLRPHLVSDLPFPFTSLQDYEASIRAPIGRNFVPETAFRMLIRPSVMTRKGAIIEPMTENELSKAPRRPSNVIDARIKRRQEEKDVKPVK